MRRAAGHRPHHVHRPADRFPDGRMCPSTRSAPVHPTPAGRELRRDDPDLGFENCRSHRARCPLTGTAPAASAPPRPPGPAVAPGHPTVPWSLLLATAPHRGDRPGYCPV